jgi:biotin carboxyl carrier protein
VRTNVRFLRWLLDQPAMRDASMRTDTLAALPVPGPPIPTDEHWRKAAAALRGTPRTPWEGGWRLNAPAAVLVAHGDHVRSVRVGGSADDAVAIDDATAHVDVDGQSLEFRLSPPPSVDSARRHASGGALGGAAVLTAPMPGRVIAVRAAQGADVAAHAPVVVIEAMKMEHAVIAPFAGRITTVSVSDGQQVQRGDALAEIEPYHAGDGDG